ncbi:MAG: HAD-IA family hydrolase [Acholeplasmatales bacterium]|jgi:HAD superfamily phosphatase (TIGR01668 family)|nr:HAD-IA family hydrolase [Acholeplasmatales bacterium]
MIKNFLPTYCFDNIKSIDYDLLEKTGISTLAFDLDYTLISFATKFLDLETISFLDELKKKFKVIIVSNSPKKRLDKVFLGCDISYISRAKKPSTKRFRKVFQDNDNLNTCMIGDQLITDILFGNRLKMKSIYLRRVYKENILMRILNRNVDRFLFLLVRIRYPKRYKEIFGK